MTVIVRPDAAALGLSRPTAAEPPARQSLSLVVPVFNEEERFAEGWPALCALVDQLPAGSELIVVDDGSSDGTAAVVTAAIEAGSTPARLVRIDHQGKGAAVAAGLAAARGELAGFCDVDLSTPLADLVTIMDVAARAGALAIGSRDLAASELVRAQGKLRETLGKLYNRLVQLTLTPGIVDTQCGAKVAPRRVWSILLPHLEERGFAWDVEAIATARRLGVAVEEVPVAWHHDDRSRVRVTRDGAAMVAALARIRRRVRLLRPAMATTGSGVFDDRQSETLLASDAAHWWFRSKAAFVAAMLKRFSPPRGLLVDVGAGAGGVTAQLGWPKQLTLAIDGSARLAGAAAQRHALLASVGEVGALPVRDGGASVVCLLDVVEHLDDPVAALREASRALGSDGVLIVTVPAHQWLWSGADELLGHRRRYTRRLLREQLRSAGLEPLLVSHVFSWLVLPVLLRRRTTRNAEAQLGLDQTAQPIDAAALVLTRLERAVLRLTSLPLGTSVLAVARPHPGASASG